MPCGFPLQCSSVAIIHCPGRVCYPLTAGGRVRSETARRSVAPNLTTLHPDPQLMSDTTSPPQTTTTSALSTPPTSCQIPPKFFYIYIFPISQYHHSLLYCNCFATLAHFTVFLNCLLGALARQPSYTLRLLTAPCFPQTLRCTTAQVAPVTHRLSHDLFTSH